MTVSFRVGCLALVCIVSASSPAHALTKDVKFCFSSYAKFVDSARRALSGGAVEHYWSDLVEYREVRGAYAEVRQGATSLFSGYLGDGLGTGDSGAGCTPFLTVSSGFPSSPSSVSFSVKTYGSVNGNYPRIYDGDAQSLSLATHTGTISVCMWSICSDKIAVEFDAATARERAMWAAYAGGSFALYRHNGGNSGKAFSVKIVSSGGNHYNAFDGYVYLNEKDAWEKFTLVHELGHRMGHLRVGGAAVDGFCVLDDELCPKRSGDHSMGSVELQSCSFSEGLAHFYAADVWNLHGGSGCVFQYYKSEFDGNYPAVDCRASPSDKSRPLLEGSGESPFPVPFMVTRCLNSSNFYDRGVEVDWLRVFWSMHNTGSSPPTFTAMLDWMDSAFNVYLSPAFPELDYEADLVGGALDSAWDAESHRNEIYHPSWQ